MEYYSSIAKRTRAKTDVFWSSVLTGKNGDSKKPRNRKREKLDDDVVIIDETVFINDLNRKGSFGKKPVFEVSDDDENGEDVVKISDSNSENESSSSFCSETDNDDSNDKDYQLGLSDSTYSDVNADEKDEESFSDDVEMDGIFKAKDVKVETFTDEINSGVYGGDKRFKAEIKIEILDETEGCYEEMDEAVIVDDTEMENVGVEMRESVIFGDTQECQKTRKKDDENPQEHDGCLQKNVSDEKGESGIQNRNLTSSCDNKESHKIIREQKDDENPQNDEFFEKKVSEFYGEMHKYEVFSTDRVIGEMGGVKISERGENDNQNQIEEPMRKTATFNKSGASGGTRMGSRTRENQNVGIRECSCKTLKKLEKVDPENESQKKSCSDSNGEINNEAKASEEKTSEVIDSREENKEVKSSNACQLLLDAILMKVKGIQNVFDSHEHKKENELPLKFSFGVVEKVPVEKTPEELEVESMWGELDFALMSEVMGSVSPEQARWKFEQTDECVSEDLCIDGNHEFILDEELGIKCIRCSFIKLEIRYNVEHVVLQEKNKYRGSSKKYPNGLDELEFQTPGDKCVGSCSHNSDMEGTVWDIIPGIKNSMYQHQQEGFEFIWNNLEGTLDLDQLKLSDSNNGGGCIISHAPGTGKTRLTIVFLQTYLEIFPNSRPVIIAPASMLLTWEEEFKKWGVLVPFHNLNNLDASASKHDIANINIAHLNQRENRNKDMLRLVKLLLWCRHKSILGISYSLYEKLVGVGESKNHVSAQKRSKEFRRILLEFPGLLVLDEGHTPRNQRSRIWKAITKVETQRRVILSGTPFQNNFEELYNILCLVRPKFASSISKDLKKFCQKKQDRRRDVVTEKSKLTEKLADCAIKDLKGIIAPFVHVHKGSILQENLPGLKDCIIVLNPASDLQKNIIETIQCSRNTFEYEHMVALITVHPSLALQVSANQDESKIDKALLEEVRLNPNEGCKTSFLMKLVRLSDAINEKVLIFSQFIGPLHLVKDQLSSVLGWTEGKEVLLMQGKLYQERRQYIINVFNDPKSEAKILLASTKACSEGISLVGASRVVLLDVVWNPSVERQAISRAYRLGQKKLVYTYHLIMLGSAEWEKYCKQAEKDRLSELVFSSGAEADGKPKILLESDDKILNEMISHNNLNGLINTIIYQPKESILIETFN